MPSEALKKALRFEDLNLRLAEMHGRTGKDMSPGETDRFYALMKAIYGGLHPLNGMLRIDTVNIGGKLLEAS